MQRLAKTRARAYTRVTAPATAEHAIRARTTHAITLANRRVILLVTTHATEPATKQRVMGLLAMDRRAKGQLAMSTRAIRRVTTHARRRVITRAMDTPAKVRVMRPATDTHVSVRVRKPAAAQRAKEPVTTEHAQEQLALCPHALSVRVLDQRVLGLPPVM